MDTTQQINSLEQKINNLYKSSDIPRDVETAFRERLNLQSLTIPSIADGATITPITSAGLFEITAVGQAFTIAAPAGIPLDGQILIIRIKDNGTGRAITWNAIYRVIGTTLPTTTVANKTYYTINIYNLADLKWDVVGTALEI